MNRRTLVIVAAVLVLLGLTALFLLPPALEALRPESTPVPPMPTPTATPEVTPTPFESFKGETATPFESFKGETSTPDSTPPPTGTSGESTPGSAPTLMLLLASLFGVFGLAAARSQRRRIRNR